MTDEAKSPEPAEEASPPQAGADTGAPEAGAAPAAKGEGDAAPLAVAPPGPKYTPSYVFLAVVTVVSLAADLGSKWWARARLLDPVTQIEKHIEVIPNYLAMNFAKNRGGAWGLLQYEPEMVRRYFFLGVSVVAIVFIVTLYRKLTPQQIALKWGLPLVLGGALGNLVNRIQYNYVVDFIDAYYVAKDGREHHWPTFNVADIAIVVGVGLMAIDMFTSRRPEGTAKGALAPRDPISPAAASASPPEGAPEPTAPPSDEKAPSGKADDSAPQPGT